jgi:large subunit ribosomal protein L24e
MVVKRQCSFCAAEIEPGTGSMFVKRDGTVFHFCSSSCRKQQLHLGRVGHRFKWTRAHALKVATDRAGLAKPSGVPAPAPPSGEKHRPAPKQKPPAAPPSKPGPPAPTEPVAGPAEAPPTPAPQEATPTAEAPTPATAKPAKRPRARKKPTPEPPAQG